MPKQSKFSKKLSKIILIYLVVLFSVVILSEISLNHRGRKKEWPSLKNPIYYGYNQSLKRFAKLNKIPEPIVKKVFRPKNGNMNLKVSAFKFNKKAKTKEIHKEYNKLKSKEKKNWKKIFLKFGLWIIGIIFILLLIKKKKFNVKSRKWIYLGSFTIFGIIFGGDPSPMGTVRDAITLFGIHNRIFIPRLIALSVFLTFVIVANKSICAWGCQFGTLQDFIFRWNRAPLDKKPGYGQIRLPFWLTNSIRILFLVAIILFAVLWKNDFVENINPFTIFSPYYLTGIGIAFIFSLLFISFFIYRPWCTIFCPFGLVGWFFEKLSILKIKVDYDKCVSCQLCVKSCPTSTMEAILKRKKTVIPDCFACMNCVEVCPKEAVSFSSGKRELPPKNKFSK